MTNTTIEKVSDDSAVRRKKKPATAEVAKKKTATASKKATAAKKAMQQFGADSPQAQAAVDAFGKADSEAKTAQASAAKQPKPATARKPKAATLFVEPTQEAARKLSQARVTPLVTVAGHGAQTPAAVKAAIAATEDDDLPAPAPLGSEAQTILGLDDRQFKHLLSQPTRLQYHGRSRPNGCLSNSEIHCLNAAGVIMRLNRESGIAIAAAKKGIRQVR